MPLQIDDETGEAGDGDGVMRSWGRLVREPNTGADLNIVLEARPEDRSELPPLRRSGARVPVDPNSFNRFALGRLPKCDVVIDDKLVSGY